MKNTETGKVLLFLVSMALLSIDFAGRTFAEGPIFSPKPIWSSGTSRSGGDGIARFIDVDNDGDPDFVTCAPNPRRWVM